MRVSLWAPIILALGWLTIPSSARSAVVFDAEGPSLAMGATGLGVLAYRDRTTGNVMVGRCTDAACTSVTTTTIDSPGGLVRHVDLAIGPAGPVIAYDVRDGITHSIRLAICADATCTSVSTVTLASSLVWGEGVAVTIGTDVLPLVAYDFADPTNRRTFVVHCDNPACSAITTSFFSGGAGVYGLDIAIGGDGFGLIAYTWLNSLGAVTTRIAHCINVACSAFTPEGPPIFPGIGQQYAYPSLGVTADLLGLPVYAGSFRESATASHAFLRRCQDTTCTSPTTQLLPAGFAPVSMAVNSANLPRIVVPQAGEPGLDLVTCLDAGCTQVQRTCLTALGREPSLVLDGAGAPLVAYEMDQNVVVTPDPGSCGPVVTIGNAAGSEPTGSSTLQFTVKVGPAPTLPYTVNYATADGTAQAGADYVATSGALTIAPPNTSGVIPVALLPDTLAEPDETFTIALSNPSTGTIADGQGTGTIVDDGDVAPTVGAGDCAVIEGDTGTTGCVHEARLSFAYGAEVTVQYATAPGTATAGVDYLSQSGTLTFAPGGLSQTVSVSVIGDVLAEPDETFTLLLSNPVNALPGDMTGDATIVDDDSPSLSDIELTHGSMLRADLAPAPGPAADQDLYRLAQSPFTSYEAVLDAVSGDAAPDARLERLAADGSTVLQTGSPIGTGSAVSLRFQNRVAVPLVGQYIRVAGASCGTACGPDDIYRLRLYETTGAIARFNNSSSQITVLLLQNPSSAPIVANVDFWDADGARRATQPATVPPHGLFVLNTSTLPALAGSSGSITVTHDGPYGGLAGKAVALEPATGFSFDSPMLVRPR